MYIYCMKTNKVKVDNVQGTEIDKQVNAQVENTDAETAKEVKVTQAGLMDETAKLGGTWAEMVARLTEQAAATKAGGKYTKGILKAHVTYRVKVQNKAWAKELVMSEEGINVKAEEK